MFESQFKKSPCKDCEYRLPGCHAKCEMYKHWRTKYDESHTGNADFEADDFLRGSYQRARKAMTKGRNAK